MALFSCKKFRHLLGKNWKILEYKTAPKVQKLNTRQSSKLRIY